MLTAIEPAAALYEEPPTDPLEIDTPWGEVTVSRSDWAYAFGAVDPGTPHNEGRDQVWAALTEFAAEQVADELEEAGADEDLLAAVLRRDDTLVEALGASWPMLEPQDLVADLWSVPAYLRRCAPWLDRDQIAALQRNAPYAWTDADLPLLDAARRRLGDPASARRQARRATARAAEREEMDAVVDHLIATDDSEMSVMSMLRGADLRDALEDPAGEPEPGNDALAA
ncbi:hypothetical protein [Mariniluteicoccus flavus]